jgi:hypothetical protein
MTGGEVKPACEIAADVQVYPGRRREDLLACGRAPLAAFRIAAFLALLFQYALTLWRK